MALILCLETSDTNCSVSLFDDDRLLHCEETNKKNSHAEYLNIFIEATIKKASITAKDLQAIAVSKGPGSYTGLRIGTSTAKGLCYGLDIPLIAVDTLGSLCRSVGSDPPFEILCPTIDARRKEIYCSLYDQDLKQIRSTEAVILNNESFSEFKNSKIVFLGSGAEKCKEELSHLENATFYSDKLPSSRFMGELAYSHYVKNDFEDVAYFTPFYLKDFIAGKPKDLLNQKK